MKTSSAKAFKRQLAL